MPFRLLIVVVLACLALGGAVPASAHTGLVDSSPADGAAIDRPVRVIELTFGQPVKLTGDGVELLDAAGRHVRASTTVDGAAVTVHPDSPLTTGQYGVRWALRAGDAHPVRDSITFTVDAGPAADTGAAVASPDRAGTAATPSAGVGGPDPADRHQVEPADDRVPDGAGSHDLAPAGEAEASGDAGAALAATLASDPTGWLVPAGVVLRAVFTAMALGVIGMIAFLVTTWEGSRRELRLLSRTVARLSTGVALVVAVQVAVRAVRSAGGPDGAVAELPALLDTTYGAGIALRLGGAVIVLAGLPALRRALRRAATVPIAGGAVDLAPALPSVQESRQPSARARWRAGAVSVCGALLIVMSFPLIGHAATAQARVVASAAAGAHVLASGIWAGGLLALSSTLMHRHRAGVPLRAGLVAVRFSALATIGVLAAAAGGVALTAMRLDSVVALWTTPYGVALSAKVIVVAAVAGIGAYNHFVVVPRLRSSPDHPVGGRLRRLALVEVTLLAAVVALTSVVVSLGS